MPQSLSTLKFVTRLPNPRIFGPETLLVYDRRLETAVPGFHAWSRGFAARYGVRSGETLKDLRLFPRHVNALLRKCREFSPARMTLVIAGGGSVGDFGGFFASVFKRGVRLVHLPTTWLAAIDSAHGGKTALNVAGGKNQIGTFYPAAEIYLVKPILLSQPAERVLDACGELAKIALLDGRPWVRSLEAGRSRPSGEWLWKHLRPAISAKYRIVLRDPQERQGRRQVLNLGHTLGHVFEPTMGLSHGCAVAQGLFFSLAWSLRRGKLSLDSYRRARSLLQDKMGLAPFLAEPRIWRRRPTTARARALLMQDKKRDGRGQVIFIFLAGFGKPIREPVQISELLAEARAQGWLR